MRYWEIFSKGQLTGLMWKSERGKIFKVDNFKNVLNYTQEIEKYTYHLFQQKMTRLCKREQEGVPRTLVCVEGPVQMR